MKAKRILQKLLAAVILLLGCGPVFGSIYTSIPQDWESTGLSKEEIDQLKQAYEQYEESMENFLRINREANKKDPNLADAETVLLIMREMESKSLPGEAKYRQYLAQSEDPNEVREQFMNCRTYFGSEVFTELVRNSVWGKGLKCGYVYMSRIVFGESGPGDQEEFWKTVKEYGINSFDLTDSNSERLWNNIRKMELDLEEFHASYRGQYIIDHNIPEYVAEYAGYYDFINGSSEAISLWLRSNTPKEVIEAAIQLRQTRQEVGKVYPQWNSVRRLLTDKNFVPDPEFVKEMREKLKGKNNYTMWENVQNFLSGEQEKIFEDEGAHNMTAPKILLELAYIIEGKCKQNLLKNN